MKTLLLLKTLLFLAIGLSGVAVNQDNYLINKVISENYAQAEPVFSTETLRMNESTYGCNKMQVSVYATYPNGQVWLRHSAIVGTGDEYNNKGYQTCSDRYDEKSGPEYVIKDEMLNGSIHDFFMSRHDIYNEFIMQKRQITGVE